MTPTDEQIAKLPRWAQEEIKRLRYDVARAQSTLNDQLGVVTKDTLVSVHNSLEPSRPLNKHTTVRFRTGPMPMDHIDVSLDWNGTKDGVNPHVICIRGGDSLQLHPNASNTLMVRNGRL